MTKAQNHGAATPPPAPVFELIEVEQEFSVPKPAVACSAVTRSG